MGTTYTRVGVVDEPPRTRTVRVMLGGVVRDVEMPAVESRFATGFREPTTDAPGLVLPDDGVVYIVAPSGVRYPVPLNAATVPLPISDLAGYPSSASVFLRGDGTWASTGGGGGLPTGWGVDAPYVGDFAYAADGRTIQLGPAGDPTDEDSGLELEMVCIAGTTVDLFGAPGVAGLTLQADTGPEMLMRTDTGFFGNPDGATSVYTASGGNGATVALDAGNLDVNNVGTIRGEATLMSYGASFASGKFGVGIYGSLVIGTTDPANPAITASVQAGGGGGIFNGNHATNTVFSISANGATRIAPDSADATSLTVFQTVGQQALAVYDSDDRQWFNLAPDGSINANIWNDNASFEVSINGGTALQVRQVAGEAALAFFDYDPVPQQPTPSTVQDIADALAAYGLLQGAGSVVSFNGGTITSPLTINASGDNELVISMHRFSNAIKIVASDSGLSGRGYPIQLWDLAEANVLWWVYPSGAQEITVTEDVTSLAVVPPSGNASDILVVKPGGGAGLAVEAGGNVRVSAGLNLQNVPSSDPHVAGQVYAIDGALFLSAG